MTWKRRLYSDIQKQRSKSKVTQSVPGLLVRVEREGGRRPDTSGTNYIVEYLINACGIVSPAESQKIKPGEEPLTYQDLALRLRKQHSGQENTLQLHQHQKENSGGKVSPPKKKIYILENQQAKEAGIQSVVLLCGNTECPLCLHRCL